MKTIALSFLLLLVAHTSRAAVVTFTSVGPLPILDGPALFVFTIEVANVNEPVAAISITFTDLFHAHPADIDALLVGPGGQKVMLMSDVGELLSEENSIIDDVNLIFRDGAPALPANTRITPGSFAPTNYQGINEEIPEMDQGSPAMPPPGPYGTSLSVFNGMNPNGTWKLFIQDDVEDESGLLGSWSVTVETIPEPIGPLLLFAGAGALSFHRARRRFAV